jgi:hypothetical protein
MLSPMVTGRWLHKVGVDHPASRSSKLRVVDVGCTSRSPRCGTVGLVPDGCDSNKTDCMDAPNGDTKQDRKEVGWALGP